MKDVHVVVYDRQSRLNTKRFTDPEDWISFIRFSYNNSKYREKAPQDLQRYLFACISF